MWRDAITQALVGRRPPQQPQPSTSQLRSEAVHALRFAMATGALRSFLLCSATYLWTCRMSSMHTSILLSYGIAAAFCCLAHASCHTSFESSSSTSIWPTYQHTYLTKILSKLPDTCSASVAWLFLPVCCKVSTDCHRPRSRRTPFWSTSGRPVLISNVLLLATDPSLIVCW